MYFAAGKEEVVNHTSVNKSNQAEKKLFSKFYFINN